MKTSEETLVIARGNDKNAQEILNRAKNLNIEVKELEYSPDDEAWWVVLDIENRKEEERQFKRLLNACNNQYFREILYLGS